MKTRIRLTIAALGLAFFNVSIATVEAQFTRTNNNGTITITIPARRTRFVQVNSFWTLSQRLTNA